jgi:hypothetical protein
MLLRGHAAIQGKDRAGGEAAFVAGKKQDAGRDLLGRADTAEELPRRQRLARSVGVGALLQDLDEIRRVNRSRRDRVAADPVAHVIDGDGARQRGHRPFRGAIARTIGDADRNHRSGVDDGPELMRIWAISTRVNEPENDDPSTRADRDFNWRGLKRGGSH